MADDEERERPKRPAKKKNTPALPLFADAYLYDTRHLSLDEHGAYFLLLLAAWRMPDCELLDDDTRLARILSISVPRWKRLKPVVMQFWSLENGTWRQKRLIQERKYVEFKRELNTLAATERWSQHTENKGEGGSKRISGRNSKRISPRNAPQPQPPKESIPSLRKDGRSDDNLNDPQSANFDPLKALFDDGVRILGEAGVKASSARSLIGKWRKDYGDDSVGLALAAAEAEHISQPLEWLPKWLAARKKREPDTSSGSLDKFMDAIAPDYLPAKKEK